MTLEMSAPATLIWLPEGKAATAEDFAAPNIEPPPSLNPNAHWVLEDAVMHASEVVRDYGEIPWIKTGETILGPSEIDQAASGVRAMKAFDAPRS
jgi:hypothetical protein